MSRRVRRILRLASSVDRVAGNVQAQAALALWARSLELLFEHGSQWIGDKEILAAIDEFPDVDGAGAPPEDPPDEWMGLFASWLVYDWLPQMSDSTIAQDWMSASHPEVPRAIVDIVRDVLQRPFSFFEVREHDCSGGRLTVRDLVALEDHVVSAVIVPAVPVGTVLFGRLVKVGAVTLFGTLGPHRLGTLWAQQYADGLTPKSAMAIYAQDASEQRNGTYWVELYIDAIHQSFRQVMRHPDVRSQG